MNIWPLRNYYTISAGASTKLEVVHPNPVQAGLMTILREVENLIDAAHHPPTKVEADRGQLAGAVNPEVPEAEAAEATFLLTDAPTMMTTAQIAPATTRAAPMTPTTTAKVDSTTTIPAELMAPTTNPVDKDKRIDNNVGTHPHVTTTEATVIDKTICLVRRWPSYMYLERPNNDFLHQQMYHGAPTHLVSSLLSAHQ